jgi:hypothetical protein
MQKPCKLWQVSGCLNNDRTRLSFVLSNRGQDGRTWIRVSPSLILSVITLIFYVADDPALPPIPSRLALVKLFLELSLYTPALLVLHGIMAADDQDVEAWYLEGWCFFLMAEQAKENGGVLESQGEGDEAGLGWEELARDARDCLETCRIVSLSLPYIF